MADIIYKLKIRLAYYMMPEDVRMYLIKALSYKIEELDESLQELYDQMNAESQESEDVDEMPWWIGKRCNDCGNEKCKSLGKLPKGHDCSLWQPESEDKE